MLTKVHHTDDHDDIVKRAGERVVSYFEDRQAIKSASEQFMQDELRQYAPDKDHFMVHLVAMGDQETFGPNKNGDGWPAEGLRKYAHTFVTNGCFFREHRNRDAKKQGIGTVKAAKYCPKMHRVEIVVWGHKKKAKQEYDRAMAGEESSYSMSARVPNDRCNACGNVARSPREYCSDLKSAMLKYIPAFEKYAFAINDKPTFFDISDVGRRADRIALYLSYAFPGEDMAKAASDGDFIITGSDWAEFEGVRLPEEAWDTVAQYHLEKLAAAEAFLSSPIGDEMKAGFARDIAPHAFPKQASDAELDAMRQQDTQDLFGRLAKRGCLLPFHTFAALATGKSVEDVRQDPTVKEASCLLPGIFKHLLGAGSIMGGSFNGAPGGRDGIDSFMDEAAKKFSVDSGPVSRRVLTITIMTPKCASVRADIHSASADSRALAEAYGVYKVAACADMARYRNMELTEPQYLLAASQNLFCD